jgi:hypothetical protein
MYAWSIWSYIQQQFTSTITESIWAHLILVHVFHMMPRHAIQGWPVHYPSLHHCMYGGIASNSIGGTKFTGGIYPACISTYPMLIPQGPTIRSLIDSGGGYHLRSFEHENTPLSTLPIWYSLLPLSCLARSQIQGDFSIIERTPIVESPSWEGALSQAVLATHLLLSSGLLSIAVLSYHYYNRNKVTWKETWCKLGFHWTPIRKCTSKYIHKVVIKKKTLKVGRGMLRCLLFSDGKLVSSLHRDGDPLSGSCINSS